MSTALVFRTPPETFAGMPSATGVLSLLEEEDTNLKLHALQQLVPAVDQHWAEIADAVARIEELSEDPEFPDRELAAFVASKCFYHLEEYKDALRLALASGSRFDVHERSEYVERMVEECIDEYKVQQAAAAAGDSAVQVDRRMEAIVEQMLERCYAEGAFTQALGIAVDARRLDKVEECLDRAGRTEFMLAYMHESSRFHVASREYRKQLLRVLVNVYRDSAHPDYLSLAQCLHALDDAPAVAEMMASLVRGSQQQVLLALQMAFDLVETDDQLFLLKVAGHLPDVGSADAAAGGADDSSSGGGSGGGGGSSSSAAGDQAASESADVVAVRQLRKILAGEVSLDLHLDFLCQQNKTDLRLLGQIKDALDQRNSVTHHACVVAHAFMSCGTTSDVFLRDNLDWLKRATNWNKFSATAGLGVIHRGHVRESMRVLQDYLPQPTGVAVSAHSEGGALYALGLIHAARGAAGDGHVVTYLREALGNTQDVAVHHGACLGLGLAAMSNGDEGMFEQVKNILYQDDAVAGEAAGLALGLMLAGRGTGDPLTTEAVREMLAYAHETQHEKLIRALSLGVAMIMFGQEEAADTVVEQLLRDKDPLVRYGGMFTVGMAYAGTGNNSAVRRLLHVAVSDVSDDVRRAAVTNLGLVLFRTPEQVPRLVSLLAESFNPHVRYGACMAVGIACAGSAHPEALKLLEPMADDKVDYVRQGAYLALAMVCMQAAEKRTPKAKWLRDKLMGVIKDKHQLTMAKMGAILGMGILDAGGRNVVISLQSQGGVTKMCSVVGLALALQYWFWFPMLHMLSLSFAPTGMIGLNKDLKIPLHFQATCNARPSSFAYPEPVVEAVEAKQERVQTVVLSTTAKSKAREARKDQAKHGGDAGGASAMAVDTSGGVAESKDDHRTHASDASDAAAAAAAGGTAEERTDASAAVPAQLPAASPAAAEEPTHFALANPSRVTLLQSNYVSFDASQRYLPVRAAGRAGRAAAAARNAVRAGSSVTLMAPVGILLLRDSRPGEPEEVRDPKAPSASDGEPEPPQPFEWTPPELRRA